MKKLLIFVDWFLPGYKAGGQIQSCANLANALKDTVEVYVVTSDRDLGDEKPYPSIKADEWNVLANNLHVNYLSPGNRGLKTLSTIIRWVNPQCIYLNSMFSFNFTLLPIEAANRNGGMQRKIILAPRGMLHTGALQYKKVKKKLFFQAFKLRGLQKKVTFHATDATEKADIKRVFGKKVSIEFVKDFPSPVQQPLEITVKKPESLRCIFISRISPKKNLLFLLTALQQVSANLQLTVAGPVEDEKYWAACQALIASLPANIQVQYLGALPNHELPAVYRQHHLFLLPTHGENFGHVIFEAFSNGRPVLISNCTPWNNLEEKGIGWDLSLSDKSGFLEKIGIATAWNQEEFNAYCRASWQFAHDYINNSGLKAKYLQLFS